MLIPNLASILGSEAAHQGAGAISKVRIQWGDTIFLGLLQKKKKWILFQNLHKFKNENMLASFIILGSKLALVKTLFFTFKIFEKKKKRNEIEIGAIWFDADRRPMRQMANRQTTLSFEFAIWTDKI